MNIVFFGNTKYSRIVGTSLFNHFGLTAVVTLPDQPLGRKKVLTPTPTKAFALEHDVPVIETLELNEQIVTKIKLLKPDFLIVADYRLFLPKSLLDVPSNAAINVHHSLLPKYRGPSPAPSAILAGEKVSGVTIMLMTQALDAGDILSQKTYVLKPEETTDSLLTVLNTQGAEILINVLEDFSTYKIQARPQDEQQATFTPHITKEDGFIDLDNPPTPEQFDRMVRAYFPWPNVWSKIKIKNPSTSSGQRQESRIKFLPNKQVQLEGKNTVDLEVFYRGYPHLAATIKRLYTR